MTCAELFLTGPFLAASQELERVSTEISSSWGEEIVFKLLVDTESTVYLMSLCFWTSTS